MLVPLGGRGESGGGQLEATQAPTLPPGWGGGLLTDKPLKAWLPGTGAPHPILPCSSPAPQGLPLREPVASRSLQATGKPTSGKQRRPGREGPSSSAKFSPLSRVTHRRGRSARQKPTCHEQLGSSRGRLVAEEGDLIGRGERVLGPALDSKGWALGASRSKSTA